MNGGFLTLNIGVKLLGYSGCTLKIISINNEYFVRKISKNKSYNKRLIRQAQIQKNRATNGTTYAPLVVSSGYTDQGLFFFDMEYISGISLKEFIKIVKLSEVEGILNTIISPRNAIKYDLCAPFKFTKKLDQLETIYKYDQNSLELLRKFSWVYMIKGKCHGDLTFENILVADKKIYLIDFLDSFYESWLIDVAKLLQDCEIYWCYRNEIIDENTHIRLLLFRQLLINKILCLKNGNELLQTIYHLLLLNLMRILPYCNTTKDKIFLDTAINYIKDKLLKGNYLC